MNRVYLWINHIIIWNPVPLQALPPEWNIVLHSGKPRELNRIVSINVPIVLAQTHTAFIPSHGFPHIPSSFR